MGLACQISVKILSKRDSKNPPECGRVWGLDGSGGAITLPQLFAKNFYVFVIGGIVICFHVFVDLVVCPSDDFLDVSRNGFAVVAAPRLFAPIIVLHG